MRMALLVECHSTKLFLRTEVSVHIDIHCTYLKSGKIIENKILSSDTHLLGAWPVLSLRFVLFRHVKFTVCFLRAVSLSLLLGSKKYILYAENFDKHILWVEHMVKTFSTVFFFFLWIFIMTGCVFISLCINLKDSRIICNLRPDILLPYNCIYTVEIWEKKLRT